MIESKILIKPTSIGVIYIKNDRTFLLHPFLQKFIKWEIEDEFEWNGEVDYMERRNWFYNI
jgi:hypothetical protein